MKRNEESMQLLRDTLERYVKDLAEELLYWVGELNKLDAGENPAATRRTVSLHSESDAPWPAGRRSIVVDEPTPRPHRKGA